MLSAQLTSNKLTIRDTTISTVVPDDPKAKLIYYIHCICCVLRTDKLDRYRNYKEYYNIPDSEIEYILELADIFNPKFLVETGIFILNEDMDGGNRFFEIKDEHMGLHANDEIVISGVRVRVLKLMFFKKNWIFKNYLEPYSILKNKHRTGFLEAYTNTSNVYSRRNDPLENCNDCNCDCNII